MAKITVLGLGPGRAGLITRESWQLLSSEELPVVLRTAIHPTVEAIKAAGITDETKAKELAEQIEKLYGRPQRPHRMPGGPRGRKPGADAPAPQK